MPAPRDAYSNSLTYVDTNGNVKPLNNAQVTVYRAGTTNKPTIYTSRDPNSSTQVANPFTTPSTGLAEFYAEAGEYDLVIVDLNSPARVANKTVSWNAAPMAVGGVPGDRIAVDALLPYGALSAIAQRQDIPIGGIIDWWRPASSVAVPTGFVICDGRQVLAADHEFPGISTAINVPDLRNKFILGASTAATDGAAGSGVDGTSGAPGIGGLTGSHQVTLTAAQMPVHTHTATQVAHGHTITDSGHNHTLSDGGHVHSASQAAHNHAITDGGHNHAVSDGGHSHGLTNGTHSHGIKDDTVYTEETGAGGTVRSWSVLAPGSPYTVNTQAVAVSVDSATAGITLSSSGTGISLASATPTITVASSATGITLASASTGITLATATPAITVANAGSGSAHTVVPHSVGLLKIIKVKRN